MVSRCAAIWGRWRSRMTVSFSPLAPPRRTALITGGAGFIGSSLVRRAMASAWRVVTLDALGTGAIQANIDGLGDGHTFVHGDLRDGSLVENLLREHRPEVVFNLAAETHVDRSIDDPMAFVQCNIVGTATLMECTRRYWENLGESEKRRFRFVQVSTDEVFGALGPTGSFTEESALAPNSPYAASKAAGDLLCRAWNKTYGFPAIVTRCSNNYGPRQFPEKLIPLMVLSALAGKSLPVYGDGSNVRDWLYVDDHCRGILAAAQHGSPGATYLFGGAGGERTNIDLVHSLCDLLDELAPVRSRSETRALSSHRELIRFVADRPGHDHRYAIDAAKTTAELGWRAEVELSAGLRSTVLWYLDNTAWCARARGLYAGDRLGLGARQ